MSDAPLSDDLGRRAGFPWYYPVIFLVNLFVIIALEALLLYPRQLPLTQEDFPDSTIRNQTSSASITWYLVEAEDASLQLVPVRKHVFLQSRGKLLSSQITPIPADTDYMEVTTKAGLSSSTVTVGTDVEPWGDEVSDYPLQMRSKYSRSNMGNNGGAAVQGKYFLLAVALSILEAVLWHKIKD